MEEDARTLLLMQDIPSIDRKIFTFWDDGSTISLVARKNDLKGVKQTYDLVTVGNVVRPQHCAIRCSNRRPQWKHKYSQSIWNR